VGQKDIPVFSYDPSTKKLIPALMAKAFSSGKKMVYSLKLRSGRTIKASGNHPFMTVSGWKKLETLKVGMNVAVPKVVDLDSEVYMDGIVSIEKLGVREVFDATIPGVENFIANDIVVHNSIEQDSDVVMFLYREEDEAPERVKLSIAKHRNGPLRNIDLFFKGDRIKFYGMESR
jgi:replicative DNA helicase